MATKFLTTREVSILLGVQPDTVGIWCRNGTISGKYIHRLPGEKGRYRISSEWLKTFKGPRLSAVIDPLRTAKKDLDFVTNFCGIKK